MSPHKLIAFIVDLPNIYPRTKGKNTKKEKDSPFIYSPTLSGGFPTREDVIKLYLNESNLDLKDIEFYTRLSYWKHAMIMEGVYIRYSMGSYGKTNENEIESVKKMARELLNKKLVACVSLNKVESLYWWNGSINVTIWSGFPGLKPKEKGLRY